MQESLVSASRAVDKKNETTVALKKIKLDKRQVGHEGFPMTSVREINILLMMKHPNVVDVTDVMVGGKDEVYMVMEYVQQDLKSFLDRYKSKLKIGEVWTSCCLRGQAPEDNKRLLVFFSTFDGTG
jgi:cell division cycle 2-like